MTHLRYLRYVIRHKWFVLIAGLRVGAPLWRLLIHDWSKFTPAEWSGYVRYFFGGWRSWADGPVKEHAKSLVQPDFDRAWLHHQKANKHHWQYWILTPDRPAIWFAIQSYDGGATGNVLVESNDFPRVEVYLPTLDCNVDTDSKRYQLVNRMVRAANRAGMPLEMPERYAREMVADWMGAGRAISGKWEAADWYRRNYDAIQLHPHTREFVNRLLLGVASPASPSVSVGGP